MHVVTVPHVAAYCKIGSLAGTSMLVLVGLMTYSTLVFLLKGSAATGAATYSQLTRVMCGTAIMKVGTAEGAPWL